MSCKLEEAIQELTQLANMPAMKGIKAELDLAVASIDNTGGETVVSTYQFGENYARMNRAANQYVSDMAGIAYADAKKWSYPRLRKWHKEKMAEEGMYAAIYNTIKKGVDNIELIEKVKDTLFLGGDTNRLKIAQLTKEVDKVARWAMTTLTSEMPEWDKRLSKAIQSPKERRLLTEVYGLSGYGATFHYSKDGVSVAEMLERGDSLDVIEKAIGANKATTAAADQLVNRLVDQTVQSGGATNAGSYTQLAALTVIRAMGRSNEAGYRMYKKMQENHPALHTKLRELSLSAYDMNLVINRGTAGMSVGNGTDKVYKDYDGHGLLDLYSNAHEMKVVTEAELYTDTYQNKMSPWKVLREATSKSPGVVYRKSQNTFEQGLGVNTDRIQNGLNIDKTYVENMMLKEPGFLVKNNIQVLNVDDTIVYRLILTKAEATTADGMDNVMQSLYRSIVHNTELTKTYALQNMIMEQFTEQASGATMEAALDRLEAKIKRNNAVSVEKRMEVKTFLNTQMDYSELKTKYPLIAKKYKVAKHVTTYGGLNSKLRYVRVGMSDMMVGYQMGSFFKDSHPVWQEIERRYKQLVQLNKLKMVVASPTKLIKDIASNAAILTSLDVDPIEGGKNMKQAFDYWLETSDIEARLVALEMEITNAESMKQEPRVLKAKREQAMLINKMEKHPFKYAYKYGFVQSLATGMMIKDFDTISGLQHTIDETVKKVTTTGDGNPNAIHQKLVKWMHWGYSIEDALEFAGKKANKSNTTIGTALIEAADRLKAHKEVGNENVAGYISEVIAGPQSEIVRQGSAVMQMSDLSAKWALFQHLIKEGVEKETSKAFTYEQIGRILKGETYGINADVLNKIIDNAGMTSLDIFVDYRLNIPSELKGPSNLGILWFPQYWLRNAVVIPQLIAAKPFNAMTHSVLSAYTGMPVVYGSHPLVKLGEGTLIHPGMDVAELSTFIPYVN